MLALGAKVKGLLTKVVLVKEKMWTCLELENVGHCNAWQERVH